MMRLLCSLVLALASGGAAAATHPGWVSWVMDGDTLLVVLDEQPEPGGQIYRGVERLAVGVGGAGLVLEGDAGLGIAGGALDHATGSLSAQAGQRS